MMHTFCDMTTTHFTPDKNLTTIGTKRAALSTDMLSSAIEVIKTFSPPSLRRISQKRTFTPEMNDCDKCEDLQRICSPQTCFVGLLVGQLFGNVITFGVF